MSSARSVAMRTTTTGWPGYLNGASVFRGSLVRIDITSPQELASYLLNSEHQSSIEAKLVDLLSNAEVLHGWILDYEIGVDDGHVGVSSWHVFVFGCLSTFVVPSHLLQVASILVDAIALGDLVLAYRCWHGNDLHDHVTDAERESLQIIALQSKMIQLQADFPDEDFQHACFQVARYRDTLRAADKRAWSQHIFVPDESMLPSFLKALS